MKPKNKKESVKKSVGKTVKEEKNNIENQYLNSIKKLELFFEEVLENHKRKIQGDILNLSEVLKGNAPKSEDKLKKISAKIETLKLKPNKGRAKDLLRIEKLLKELTAFSPEKEI